MSVPWAEVIGDPIAQSKSPAIHGFWLERLGIPGRYDRCLVKPEALADYLASRRADPDWRGCNVTMPHKQAIIPLLDRLDPLAARIGAVNTVVREGDGTLAGYNTDITGVAEPLSKHKIGGYPNHVATYVYIIGAGGAAWAAASGAAMVGFCDFDIFNRSQEKADTLAAFIGAPFGKGHPLEALAPIRNPDEAPEDQRYSHVVINASSMGMGGKNPVPIDLSQFHSDTIVFDMVYSPLDTPLLVQASQCGLRTIDGLQMLVAQAAVAFRYFFGSAAPREFDAELRAKLLS